MKVFVTGVNGQLGHDVMNELAKRGYEGVGSDLAPEYAGVADGSSVTKAPYVSLDITDADAVDKVISEVNPDVIVHQGTQLNQEQQLLKAAHLGHPQQLQILHLVHFLKLWAKHPEFDLFSFPQLHDSE